jgi:hypothetical protein
MSRASWSGAAHVIDITDELSHARVFTCGFGIPHLWFEARKTSDWPGFQRISAMLGKTGVEPKAIAKL